VRRPASLVPVRSSDPSDVFLDHFGYAAARGACFELTARMLADKSPSLRKFALSCDLTPLLAKIHREYATALSEPEGSLLHALAGIRNKLFHLELSRVTGRIKSLTESLRESGVVQLDLETGETRDVASTNTADGRIFGWLMESSMNGAFAVGAEKFLEGIAILERLMTESDRRFTEEPEG
jgi:hypothetical protein